jgi:hypothetical protein
LVQVVQVVRQAMQELQDQILYLVLLHLQVAVAAVTTRNL